MMPLPRHPQGSSWHRVRACLVAAFLSAAAAAGTTLRAAESNLAERIAEVINAPEYKQANWGILAVDMETGAAVYERQADKLFAPASTTKLFSVAAALDAFGPEHTFKTHVIRRGEVDADGQLNGDLILVASGDFTLGGRTDNAGRIAFKDTDHTYANGNSAATLTDPHPLGGLADLSRQIAAAGIRRITGEILVDDRLFEKAEGTGSGPARLTPMMVNDNVIDIVVAPTEAGMAAVVNTRPKTTTIRIDAQVDTVEAGKETRTAISVISPGRIIVRGQIAANQRPLLRVYEVEDAASYARALFIETMRRNGITVEASHFMPNRAELLPAPNSYRAENRVATLTSPPFSEAAKLILKVSHNLHASTLPLLLAAYHGKRTLADGLRLERDFLVRAGVDVNSISFSSGAGGGRGDFTTPEATVQLLRHMATRPDFPAYEAALPVLGVDGTAATAVDVDSPARGKVRAKTGTLSWEDTMNDRFVVVSKALAGYLTTAHGRKLAFAMFVNGTHITKSSDTTREGQTLGRLCEILYEDDPPPLTNTSRRPPPEGQ